MSCFLETEKVEFNGRDSLCKYCTQVYVFCSLYLAKFAFEKIPSINLMISSISTRSNESFLSERI